MKKSWNRDAWVACALILTACQTVEGPGASLPPPRPVNQAAGLGAWSIPVDVDPLHGSAFERVQSEEGLRPLVAFPDVTHDLNTGRTTVTLSVTHAGAAPVELSVQVQSGRTLLTSSEQLRLGVVAPGGSLTVPLVFENPQAGGFPLTLSLRADVTTASAPPRGNFALQQVAGWVATASNSLGTLVPGQAVDGNLGTQWANEAFRAASAWLAIDTGAVRPMAAVRVKMTPFSGGASYRIEVSDDGTTWRSVSGPLRNTTWQLETKVFSAPTEARHVRLVFTNDPVAPEGRFSVFEVGTDFQAGGVSPSPSPTPTPTPSPTPTPTPTPTPAVGVWVATANSSLGTLVPAQAIDENLSTQWANGTFRAPNAWLAVDTGARRPMAAVRVKLPPFAGEVNYRIEVSDDGTTWRSVSGPLRNTSWQLETKLFSAPTEARHVRLVFTNDPAAPVSHFSVFELGRDFQAGGVAPTPTPTPSVTPSPSPTPTPTPTPSPSMTPPPPPGSWVRNFETDALGSDPADFIDPLDEGYSYAWMPRVPWRVDVLNGSKQYIHDGLANMAFLNFRRWRGDALGTPDGRLPDRYFTELDVTPLRSYTYAPTGDQGTQVYYLDPVNYVEVLIKPNIFEVWSATNAPPFQSGGWNRIYWVNMNTAAGQTRRLGTEVDAQTGRMRVFVDGNELVTVNSPVLTPRAHWFALRGAGNVVAHDNIRIEPR